jgi:hypothetical protein
VSDVVKAIRAAQKRAFEYGHQTVRDELKRQGARLPGVQELQGDPTAGKNRKTSTSTMVSSAEVTAKRNSDAWLSRTIDEAIRQRRTGLQGEALTKRLIDVLEDEAASGAKRDAAGEIHEAFGLGRANAAQELADSIESCEYSAILDASTCPPCADLDGETFVINSDAYFKHLPPNVNCEGRDNCRCVMLYVARSAEQQAHKIDARIVALQQQIEQTAATAAAASADTRRELQGSLERLGQTLTSTLQLAVASLADRPQPPAPIVNVEVKTPDVHVDPPNVTVNAGTKPVAMKRTVVRDPETHRITSVVDEPDTPEEK